MVFTCDQPFPEIQQYQEIFSQYPFELSNFQKTTVQQIQKMK